MPIVQPDTSSVQNTEPGTYPASITGIVVDTSQKGDQMLRMVFEVNANGKMKNMNDIVMLEGRGVFKLIDLLRAIDQEDLANNYVDPASDMPPLDTDVLQGAELEVVVDTEMYEGRARDSIHSYLKA